MQNIKIKICGITSVEDAKVVCSFPIHAIGLNFVTRSKRRITIQLAKNILNEIPKSIHPVLVFENEEIDRINHICKLLNVSLVQLHGLESLSYCRNLNKRNSYLRIIKVFPVKESSMPLLKTYEKVCKSFLLDSSDSKNQMGGTGETADWDVARKIVSRSKLPVFLAGGLNSKNIIMAIKKVSPYAIDINSGIESSIGKKDKKLLEKLFIRLAGIK